MQHRGLCAGLVLIAWVGIGCAQGGGHGVGGTGDVDGQGGRRGGGGREAAGLAALGAGAGLVPSAMEERARFEAALGSELEGHLRHLGGVLEASVVIDLPVADPLAPAPPVPLRATASVVLVMANGAAPEVAEEARRLVAGAVNGLSVEAVTVVATPGPKAAVAPALARVGPFAVAPGSRRPLQLTLAAALLAIAAMAGWVFAVERRRREQTVRHPGHAATPTPPTATAPRPPTAVAPTAAAQATPTPAPRSPAAQRGIKAR